MTVTPRRGCWGHSSGREQLQRVDSPARCRNAMLPTLSRRAWAYVLRHRL